MDERKEHLLRKPISQQILRHYRLTIIIIDNVTIQLIIKYFCILSLS